MKYLKKKHISLFPLFILLLFFGFHTFWTFCSTLNKENKIRFLWFSNGGLIGYYENGDVKICTKCDPIKSNILRLNNSEKFDTYTYTYKDSCILTSKEINCINFSTLDKNPFWLIVDYKWTSNLIDSLEVFQDINFEGHKNDEITPVQMKDELQKRDSIMLSNFPKLKMIPNDTTLENSLQQENNSYKLKLDSINRLLDSLKTIIE